MRPGENPATVMAFFLYDKPKTGNGWARLADAYAASGRSADALAAAKNAWGEADLSVTDEQSLSGPASAAASPGRPGSARGCLALREAAAGRGAFPPATSPQRQAAFAARIAMQNGSPDADARYGAVIGTVTSDAGLLMDRARYLRSKGYEQSARDLAARSHSFVYRPADPERFYDMLLLLANGAAQDRQWQTAYQIARSSTTSFPGARSSANSRSSARQVHQPGFPGRQHRAGPHEPAVERGADVRPLRPRRQVAPGADQGQLLGGSRRAGGRAARDRQHLLPAGCGLSGAVLWPACARAPRPNGVGATRHLPQYVTTLLQRTAFNSRPLVQAVRVLGQQNRPTEQALFVRALAESLDNDGDRNLAVDFAQQVRRPDLPVWTARMARVKGSMFYVRQAYPTLGNSVPGDLWSLSHGITRQESSYDPYAVSHAGARGMMQLMPGTAREQAGKMGLGYDSYRLLSDPGYNVMLGSAYFQRMMNMWGGNVPLAVASYNAGYGNVRKWVNAYGDPRGQVDVLKWIEAIPFSETKAYVQRVIENSVVYDSMRSGSSQQTAMHVSRYLGKSRPG